MNLELQGSRCKVRSSGLCLQAWPSLNYGSHLYRTSGQSGTRLENHRPPAILHPARFKHQLPLSSLVFPVSFFFLGLFTSGDQQYLSP